MENSVANPVFISNCINICFFSDVIVSTAERGIIETG